MKDSYKHLTEKQLADKGWEEMKTLLDRDMPVQRKRRRGFIWMYQLAAALLIPALGIGAWHWHTEKTLLAQETMVANGDNSPLQPTEKSSDTKIGAAIPFNDSSFNTTAAMPPPMVAKGQKTKTLFRAVSSKTVVPLSPNFTTPPKSGTSNQAQTAATPVSTNSLHAVATHNFPAIQQTSTTVATLSTRTVVFPNTLDMPDTSAGIEPQTVKAPQALWAFGAGAGIQTSTNFESLNGAVAGVSVDYHLNRRFGIRSGLNYQAFKPDNSERPIASLSADSYTEATGFENFDGGILVTSSADLQVDVPLARLHRVEAPLLAYWQPLNMLRVFGGMRLGYNIYAQSAQRAQTEFGAFDTPEKGSDARALNRNLTQTISKWEPSWSSGLGIGIGKKAEIGLFYNHPWSSQKKDQNEDIFLPGPTTSAGNAKPGATNASSFQLSATVFF